jgi:hypothetical protein
VRAFMVSMGPSRTARRLRLAPACVAAGLFASGCGGAQSGSEQVRGALQRFAVAVAGRDYREVCGQLLAANLTERLAQIGLPCEQAMATGFGRARYPRLVVRSVQVRGTTAAAVVYTTASNQPPSQDTLQLVKVGGSWRISALGSTS